MTYDSRDGMKKEAKTHNAPALVVRNDSQQHVQTGEQQTPYLHEHLETPPGQEGDEMVMTVHRPLVDPLVNDLDQHSRYYLHHFATQLCDVMVVYDTPGQNPIRDLIPATSAYPLLFHVSGARAG